MIDFKKIKEAVNLISKEKKIPKEELIEVIESAIRTAYRKDFLNKDANLTVKLDLDKEEIEIIVEKEVVKEVKNPYTQISFEELGEDAEWFEEGDIVEIDETDNIMNWKIWESFWRIASWAARQVIIQKISEAEKNKIYNIFKDKQWEIIPMKIDMVEWNKVIFDYNWDKIPLPKSEQVSRDNYTAWARKSLYIAEASKDEEWNIKVILTRKAPELVVKVFESYVPELLDWTIEILKVARIAWIKTKLVVKSNYDEIDPVWTMIWQKWIRVKSVMEEIWWERIDVIPYSEDDAVMIKNSLTPAEIISVEIDDENKKAFVVTKVWEKSKAVGKNGVNIKLASEITWYDIDIKEEK
jgi:N utilization substance protein A